MNTLLMDLMPSNGTSHVSTRNSYLWCNLFSRRYRNTSLFFWFALSSGLKKKYWRIILQALTYRTSRRSYGHSENYSSSTGHFHLCGIDLQVATTLSCIHVNLLVAAVVTMKQRSTQPNRDHCSHPECSNRLDDRRNSNWIRCQRRNWFRANDRWYFHR